MPDEATSESKPVEPTEPTPEASKESGPEFDPYAIELDALATKIESDVFPEEPEAKAATEAEVEETPSVEAAVGSEPEVEKPTGEAEEEFSEADELRAMLDVQKTEAKRFESLLGRQTGEDGFFKKKAEKLEGEIAELRRVVTSEEAQEPPERLPASQQPQPVSQDANTTYLINLAVGDASNKFFANTPDALKKNEQTGQMEVDQEFHSALEEIGAKTGSAEAIYADPIEAATEATRLLESAWAKVDHSRKVTRLENIQRRRAEQGKRLKDKKRASAASSTVRDAGPAPKKPVDPYTMPMEELTKLAQAEGEEEERARS